MPANLSQYHRLINVQPWSGRTFSLQATVGLPDGTSNPRTPLSGGEDVMVTTRRLELRILSLRGIRVSQFHYVAIGWIICNQAVHLLITLSCCVFFHSAKSRSFTETRCISNRPCWSGSGTPVSLLITVPDFEDKLPLSDSNRRSRG